MSDLPKLTVPRVGTWQEATVTDIRVENPRVKTFSLALAEPAPHVAGQHFVVRLTAPDGYTAQRSYSVASPPGDGTSIDLTVERLPDGEVSTFLHDELRVGDSLEVRGPIGGWFVWDGSTPALLIGGGSGIVPLMAMLRLARRQPSSSPVHLLVSARQPADLIYADELTGDDTTVLFTRVALPDSVRAPGRITPADVAPHVSEDAIAFVCGSAGFAAAASEIAMQAGFDSQAIRVERFGPTG
ncbi:MAG TPA: FAD-binding oxidoreductase [Ilumatobacter sp.]